MTGYTIARVWRGLCTAAALFTVLVNAGCASIFCSPSTVNVGSRPPGATIYINGEKSRLLTPASMPLRQGTRLALEKEGYVGQELVLDRGFNWKAAPLIVPDLFCFGLLLALDICADGFYHVITTNIVCELASETPVYREAKERRNSLYRPLSSQPGTGVIHVYLANLSSPSLQISVTAESAGERESEGELYPPKPPLTFIRTPGQYFVYFQNINFTRPTPVVVETGRVTYVRATAECLEARFDGHYTHQTWGLILQVVSESEALTDLYHLNTSKK